jgi:hypothetical protein
VAKLSKVAPNGFLDDIPPTFSEYTDQKSTLEIELWRPFWREFEVALKVVHILFAHLPVLVLVLVRIHRVSDTRY